MRRWRCETGWYRIGPPAWRFATPSPNQNLAYPSSTSVSIRLHEFGEDTMEFFLGDLLGYWRREWRHTSSRHAPSCKPIRRLTRGPRGVDGVWSSSRDRADR